METQSGQPSENTKQDKNSNEETEVSNAAVSSSPVNRVKTKPTDNGELSTVQSSTAGGPSSVVKTEDNSQAIIQSNLHTKEDNSGSTTTAVTSASTQNNKKPETSKESTAVKLALPKVDDRKKSKKSGGSSKDGNTAGGSSSTATHQSDPSKIQDVLFSAGVDIREEEALLHSSVHHTLKTKNQSQTSLSAQKLPKHLPFLHPDQVKMFMRRAITEFNFKDPDSITENAEVLGLISSACEFYMRDILTNAIVISRHRRKSVKINAGRRGEVSVALRAIAMQQKKDEERRLKKRITLGLEKENYENKMDSEEVLHRASNVTAGLRAGSRKHYGWLTSSVSKPTSIGLRSAGRVASDIAARGESGLRFREAREEPGIVMRDLLGALESRRIGVQNAISKGYARIRD